MIPSLSWFVQKQGNKYVFSNIYTGVKGDIFVKSFRYKIYAKKIENGQLVFVFESYISLFIDDDFAEIDATRKEFPFSDQGIQEIENLIDGVIV